MRAPNANRASVESSNLMMAAQSLRTKKSALEVDNEFNAHNGLQQAWERRRQMSPPDQRGRHCPWPQPMGHRAREPRHPTAKALRTKSTRGCVRLINRKISSHGQLPRLRDACPRPQAVGVQPIGRGCREGGEQRGRLQDTRAAA